MGKVSRGDDRVASVVARVFVVANRSICSRCAEQLFLSANGIFVEFYGSCTVFLLRGVDEDGGAVLAALPPLHHVSPLVSFWRLWRSWMCRCSTAVYSGNPSILR